MRLVNSSTCSRRSAVVLVDDRGVSLSGDDDVHVSPLPRAGPVSLRRCGIVRSCVKSCELTLCRRDSDVVSGRKQGCKTFARKLTGTTLTVGAANNSWYFYLRSGRRRMNACSYTLRRLATRCSAWCLLVRNGRTLCLRLERRTYARTAKRPLTNRTRGRGIIFTFEVGPMKRQPSRGYH